MRNKVSGSKGAKIYGYLFIYMNAILLIAMIISLKGEWIYLSIGDIIALVLISIFLLIGMIAGISMVKRNSNFTIITNSIKLKIVVVAFIVLALFFIVYNNSWEKADIYIDSTNEYSLLSIDEKNYITITIDGKQVNLECNLDFYKSLKQYKLSSQNQISLNIVYKTNKINLNKYEIIQIDKEGF